LSKYDNEIKSRENLRTDIRGDHQWPAILLVEDDEDIRGLVTEYLRMAGFRVLGAAGVDDALALWNVDGGAPRLILSDLHLGGKSGYDLYWLIRRHHPALPFIMMSSDPSLKKAAPGDANLVLMRKPFSYKTLWTILARILPGEHSAAAIDNVSD
jgi:DNA-binding NtrC family response regulator